MEKERLVTRVSVPSWLPTSCSISDFGSLLPSFRFTCRKYSTLHIPLLESFFPAIRFPLYVSVPSPVYSGYICPETIIPAGLFHFYTDFCRLYDCNSADLIYYLPHCTRIFVRYGYGRRKHAGYRHHAVFPTGRRIGLLRTDQ